MDNTQIILDKYIIYTEQIIGKGSYSNIYLGKIIDTDINIAGKCIDISKINPDLVKHEIAITRHLDHKNIITILDNCYIGDKAYIILEYCEKGDLSKIIKDINSEEMIKEIFNQIVDGVKYLKECKIIHRDLKPHNILITKDNIIKISDFGFADYEDSHNLYKTICGSPYYMAPEMLKYCKYSDNVDLWSLGIILYQLCYKKVPFNSTTIPELIFKLSNNKIIIKNGYSTECTDLIKKLLVLNPQKRITWNSFFNHPWLKTKHNKSHIFKNISINYTYLLENTKFISKPIPIPNKK